MAKWLISSINSTGINLVAQLNDNGRSTQTPAENRKQGQRAAQNHPATVRKNRFQNKAGSFTGKEELQMISGIRPITPEKNNRLYHG